MPVRTILGAVLILLGCPGATRADNGDHDRVGASMRFFDPPDSRPTVPDAAFLTPKKR